MRTASREGTSNVQVMLKKGHEEGTVNVGHVVMMVGKGQGQQAAAFKRSSGNVPERGDGGHSKKGKREGALRRCRLHETEGKAQRTGGHRVPDNGPEGGHQNGSQDRKRGQKKTEG